MTINRTIDKGEVRRSFSRAASTYDANAVLQREAGQRLFDRLDFIVHSPKRILDLGCGTGLGSFWLAKRYPYSEVLALDLAMPMLDQLNNRAGFWDWLNPNSLLRRIHPICGDMDALPFRSGEVDMIWSAFALQWSVDLDATLAEMYRVMKEGGLLMFATFGPDTLVELRKIFAKLDGLPHVSQFIDMHDVGDALIRAGFVTPVMDMEYFTLTYKDVKTLMRDLKDLGAHNAAHGRMRGLSGRGWLARITEEYEFLRREGLLPATFEVVYGHAWAGSFSHLPDKKTIRIIPDRGLV
ncbi:MAG TPA: malonyl-ACP O-methyltransferase BioC [Burkholderiales bacterium]|nr:malonyl-ACP O-methyltransferase BioC [Burkholderiales bacterium]